MFSVLNGALQVELAINTLKPKAITKEASSSKKQARLPGSSASLGKQASELNMEADLDDLEDEEMKSTHIAQA
ncbi:hypothetical protein Moror_7631 [Moniliophthora roreri MCA 2997]|uniref:Uncharacterized protein n=1 Tax=Moniliophthora roreri (strain MCA 2997) TaxID=1381753 RepID=V2WK99_MONRO|nr:hypothetical protein Moror_7631 [Moniliophthora roreri MCA 2997]